MKRAILLLALAIFAAFSVRLKLRLLAESTALGPLAGGREAPPLVLETLDGERVDLKQIVGEKKLVLVNFWATWCTPCRIEMPQLAELYDEFGEEGLAILAITQEDPGEVEAFLRTNAYPFPILLDPGGLVTAAYSVRALPTTVMVDGDGKVLRSQEGVDPLLKTYVTTIIGQAEHDTSAFGGGHG